MSIHAEIYGYATLLLLALSLWRGSSRQGGVSFLILLAWCVNVPLSKHFPGYEAGIQFLIAEDIVLGAFIIWSSKFASEKAKNWQRIVGAWFVLMLANHVIFLVTKYNVTDVWAIYYVEYSWWLGKTIFAWLQLLTLALWIGGKLIGNLNFDTNSNLWGNLFNNVIPRIRPR